ncbi:MAG TPA: anthrone oxygenase family protein [Tepidisphaeraceae bacterium]|nr:anthrone oxygenase family protein [Tepidisphaeraceae bacterium]
MTDRLLAGLVIVGAIGAGVIGGVFFAFSSFVMGALGRVPAREGVRAMQAINVVVLNPLFLGVFVGTAIVCAAAGAMAVWYGAAGRWWVVAGGGLYVVGTFGVTVACNVPLNDRLARVDADAPEAEGVWVDYQRRWARWNHVRTAAAVGAMVAMILAIRM